MSDLKKLRDQLRKFAKDRDWEQFHTPKNLTLALVGEVGELAEVLQWLSDKEIKKLIKTEPDKVADELADVLLYLIRLSDQLKIDLMSAAIKKIKKNELNYPVKKSKGKHAKYDTI